MSDSPSPLTVTTDRTAFDWLAAAQSLATSATAPAVALVRAAGFWTAVALPALYVPLLYGGLDAGQATAFLALLVAHVAALVVGHGHERE